MRCPFEGIPSQPECVLGRCGDGVPKAMRETSSPASGTTSVSGSGDVYRPAATWRSTTRVGHLAQRIATTPVEQGAYPSPEGQPKGSVRHSATGPRCGVVLTLNSLCRAARAAKYPHMPCTPGPGGVDAEHRYTPGRGVR
ncbi:hypothetical protein EHYA_10100 [Embleya hyalina]|uniref:Uncharacterized protein n=1 Tax=Embleya hyalina TaxID=516124 RepID=A0A401Z657_9ACTN|nr:hypothetical protein EHYA_10100 [Embleya hyalina]